MKWKFLDVSCGADSLWCFAEVRPMGGHVMFGDIIYRTQWTVTEAVHLQSLLIFDSLRKTQLRENF